MKPLCNCNHALFIPSAPPRGFTSPLAEILRYYSHHSLRFRFRATTAALINQKDHSAKNVVMCEWNKKPKACFHIWWSEWISPT